MVSKDFFNAILKHKMSLFGKPNYVSVDVNIALLCATFIGPNIHEVHFRYIII